MIVDRSLQQSLLIRDCPLAIRTKNALIKGGVTTVEELMHYRPDDLLRFPHFGPKALADVRAFLSAVVPPPMPASDKPTEKFANAPRGRYAGARPHSFANVR